MSNPLHEFMTGQPYSQLSHHRVLQATITLLLSICVAANFAVVLWTLRRS